jgi:CspA family cold shock protein
MNQFLRAAYLLKDSRGSIQFVKVGRNNYTQLLNTNIEGNRLINLAEIYTGRTAAEILNDIDSILQSCIIFDVREASLSETLENSNHGYEKQHNGSVADKPGKVEQERRKKEYGLMECIRFIEQRRPVDLRYLNYNYMKNDKFYSLDDSHISRYIVEDNIAIPKAMRRGICKSFNHGRGYGFIIPDGGGKELFVHYANIIGSNSLKEGNSYMYRIIGSKKLPRAVDVIPAEG